jgi:hypothetical protein
MVEEIPDLKTMLKDKISHLNSLEGGLDFTHRNQPLALSQNRAATVNQVFRSGQRTKQGTRDKAK